MNAKEIGGTNPEASIMLIGDSGSGKTNFLGGIPNVFIYDFDAGMATLRGKDIEYQTFKDAPQKQKVGSVLKKRGFYEYGTAWPAFIEHLNNTVGKAIDEGTWGNRPIALDSLTILMNMAMNHVIKESGRKVSDGIRIQDWGQQIGLVETVLDQLTAWPILLITTAHVQRDTNQLLDTVEMLPLLTGKFAGRAPIYFDEVWYTSVTGKSDARKYTLITESTGMVKQAKSRYGIKTGTPSNWEAVKPMLIG